MIYPSCHIIPTLKGISTRDSFSCRRDMSRLECFLRKEMRILRLHLILPFPCIFRSPVRVPPNLNDTNLAVTQAANLVIKDLYRFFHNPKTIINLDLFQWNDERLVSQTLLQV